MQAFCKLSEHHKGVGWNLLGATQRLTSIGTIAEHRLNHGFLEGDVGVRSLFLLPAARIVYKNSSNSQDPFRLLHAPA